MLKKSYFLILFSAISFFGVSQRNIVKYPIHICNYPIGYHKNINHNFITIDEYQKKDGTIVSEHIRTQKNETNWDNYTAKGNKNPLTFKEGNVPKDYTLEAFEYNKDKTIYTGERGGQYYYNDNGKKVYVPKIK